MGSATGDGGSPTASASKKDVNKPLKVAMEAMTRGFEKYSELEMPATNKECHHNVAAWCNVSHQVEAGKGYWCQCLPNGNDLTRIMPEEPVNGLEENVNFAALERYKWIIARVRSYGMKAMRVHPDKNMSNEKAAEAFKKLQNAYEVLLDSLKRKAYDDKKGRLELFSMESVVSLPLGLHNQRLKVTTPFWRIKANSFAKGVATFISWYIPRNQNPKQDGARTAKIFIKQKMEMDGLSNLHNPSFLDYCRRLLPLHMFAQIARYMMPLTGIFGMRCPANSHMPSFHVNTSITSKHNTSKGSSSGQRSVQAGEFDNYSSGTSNESPSARPEMVQRVAEVAVAVATKGRKRGRSNGESYIFLHPHPPQVLPEEKGLKFVELYAGMGKNGFKPASQFVYCCDITVQLAAYLSDVKRLDELASKAKPDEAIGPFPEAILLKEKKAQEDGRVLPEFADAEEEKLFEFLNLELQSELKVERLRHYEVVYLIHEKHEEEVGSVNEKVQDFVREKKGRIWRFNDWGMRRLAYKIQKAKNAHYILMNFELEARWINDFKNMLDKDERVIRHLVIKRDEAITEDCPPPPEFQTLQGGMDNHDEEDGVDYDDDDDEAYDEDWEAEAEAVYDDEAEGSVISLHGYKEDDDGNNEVRHSKFASSSNTRKKADT
ncbi:hypothetical protein NC651_020270 [Populus alba x Populus x berolinensis]|nr:hypothetical protein NC651_020270 [Populus alba x Populus x berolinensis]